jgi:hypothetical protein
VTSVLGLVSRLVDDWPPVLKVTIVGCFSNLYQMTHSIVLLFPCDHIPQLKQLLTLGYLVLDTRNHPCLVVFQLRCFQRLARVLDVLDGVVQDVVTRMRGCCGAGKQLQIDVADLFNRIADLPRSGGDGLLCSARGLVQLTG